MLYQVPIIAFVLEKEGVSPAVVIGDVWIELTTFLCLGKVLCQADHIFSNWMLFSNHDDNCRLICCVVVVVEFNCLLQSIVNYEHSNKAATPRIAIDIILHAFQLRFGRYHI